MKITRELTDSAVLQELGVRLAQRRVDAGLTQEALAAEAGVSKRTVERVEGGHTAELGTLIRLLRALDLAAGLESLVPELPASPIALRETGGRRRRRVSARAAAGAGASGRPWTWAE